MDPIRSSFEHDPDMCDLIEEFVGELPARADALEECLGTDELAKLQTLAHQLKGAGGGYGFDAISETAAALEGSLKAGEERSRLKEGVAKLCDVLRAAVGPEGA